MAPYFNDRQWGFLYKLHCFGYTYKELATWLGVSPNTIKYNFYKKEFKCFDREPLNIYSEQFKALGGDRHVRS